MFIYIGNDEVVEAKKIISILEYELIYSSPKLRQLIEGQRRKNKVYGSPTDAKSIIVTDDFIHFSPFSTSTLKKKEELYGVTNQETKNNNDIPQ